MADPVGLVAAALFGATIGSYLNVVIYRMPRASERQFGHRSICVHCGAQVPGYLNLPIVSWLVLLGRTKCCGKRLSPRYPFVEALTAAMFMALIAWPPSNAPVVATALTYTAVASWIWGAFFVANLIANTFIDFEFRILPDKLTKPLMVVGVVGAVVVPDLVLRGGTSGLAGTASMAPAVAALLTSVVGLGAGLGLTWGVRAAAHAAFKKEAMGLGDVKLMGGVGAFLGWDGAVMTFFLGAMLGSVGGGLIRLFTKDPYVAFGPYLAMGAVVTLFFKERILTLVTEDWPAWQRQYASSPWVVALIGLISLVLLVVLVRRGRSR